MRAKQRTDGLAQPSPSLQGGRRVQTIIGL
jgi:hypothetical protein